MKHIFLFPLGKVIDGRLRNQLTNVLSGFASQWTDHGEQVYMEVEFPYNAILLLRVWKASGVRIDGCAQDKLFNFIKQLSNDLQLPLLRFDLIPVIIGQSVSFYTLAELRDKLQKREISAQTPIILFSVRSEEEWNNMPIPIGKTAIYKQLIQ